jgi:hypothetical protein
VSEILWSAGYKERWVVLFCSRCAVKVLRYWQDRLSESDPLYCIPCLIFVYTGEQLKGARA